MDELRQLAIRGVVVGVFQENCWVIGSQRSKEAIIVDPGDEPDRIMALVRDMGLDPKLIICSHAHLDHIMAARAVQEATAAQFVLHPADIPIARTMPQSASRFLGYEPPPPPEPDLLVNDGDTVAVDGVSLQVIHVPGHTPGSVAYYTEGLLFSGDTLFYNSIGRTDLPGGDYGQIMHSIITRLLPLPDATIVLPGHMQETRIGHERATNPFVLQELARLHR